MPPIKIHGMIDPHTHLRDLDWSHKGRHSNRRQSGHRRRLLGRIRYAQYRALNHDDRLTDKLARIDKARIATGGSISAHRRPTTAPNTSASRRAFVD